jgi:hypothetical protein
MCNLGPMILVAKCGKILHTPVWPPLELGNVVVFDYHFLDQGQANTFCKLWLQDIFMKKPVTKRRMQRRESPRPCLFGRLSHPMIAHSCFNCHDWSYSVGRLVQRSTSSVDDLHLYWIPLESSKRGPQSRYGWSNDIYLSNLVIP